MKATIKLQKPHKNQAHILTNKKRFNVLRCGRRFGKTELAVYLIIKTYALAKNNNRVAYFAPSYKMMKRVWNQIVKALHPIIEKKDSTLMKLELKNGSIIDFWSLVNPDSARGEKYNVVIVDEAAMVDKLEYAWTQVLRPLLTDFKGDAWFLSTPKGRHNYFYYLSQLSNEFEDWASFHFTSYDNPVIDAKEIDLARQLLDALTFNQEYLAEFVDFAGNIFAYEFQEKKHVGKVNYNPNEPVFCSFDFNITNTCLVFQHNDNEIKCLKEYNLQGMDLEGICGQILIDFPDNYVFVTGDASGRSGSAYTSGNVSAYHLIKLFLAINDNMLKTPLSNPSHINSRILTNVILKKLNVIIDENCKGLIKDLNLCTVNSAGKIDKSDLTLTHHLDCLRYYLWTFHYSKIKELGLKMSE